MLNDEWIIRKRYMEYQATLAQCEAGVASMRAKLAELEDSCPFLRMEDGEVPVPPQLTLVSPERQPRIAQPTAA